MMILAISMLWLRVLLRLRHSMVWWPCPAPGVQERTSRDQGGRDLHDRKSAANATEAAAVGLSGRTLDKCEEVKEIAAVSPIIAEAREGTQSRVLLLDQTIVSISYSKYASYRSNMYASSFPSTAP